MCIAEVVLYPDQVLRRAARQVDDVSSEETQRIIAALLATMDEYSHCVGLAANQIGSDLNIFVADASKNARTISEHGRIVVINGEIVAREDLETKREGCMSVPDLTGNVSRARHVTIAGKDQDGKDIELRARDFEARVFQHEIDHLSGKVFLDRVTSTRDVFARKIYVESEQKDD